MIKETLAPGIVSFYINTSLAKNILNEFKTCNLNLWKNSKTSYDILNNREEGDKKYRNSDSISLKHNFSDLNKKLEFEVDNVLFEYRLKYIDAHINVNSKEIFNGLRYTPGGYYNIHSDSSIFNYRTISCLIYLNPEEYDGGETFFKYFDLNYKPKNSSILIFPSGYIYSHSAMPVLSGVKYVIANWFSDLHKIDEYKSHTDISILHKDNLVEIDGDKYFKIPKGRHNDK